MGRIFKAVLGIFVSFFFLTASFADENEFKEGEHFAVLSGMEISETQEITEFMSFYCGHCYVFRSVFNQLRQAFPEVTFKINPVSFLGGEMGPMTQRAYAAAAIMGIEEQFSNELFNQIHQMHKTDYNPDALGDIIAYVGGDKVKFMETFDSFISMSQVAAYNAEMDKAGIKGVPTIVVNHKYQILKAEKDQVVPLIKYLLNKDNIPASK